MSKKTINIALNFDLDILAFLILGDSVVFQCIDYRFVSTSYWKIHVSSQVIMFSISPGSSSNLSRESEQTCWRKSFKSGVRFFGTNFAQHFVMCNSSCKIYLTVSLSAFTASAIIRMLIPRTMLCTHNLVDFGHCFLSWNRSKNKLIIRRKYGKRLVTIGASTCISYNALRGCKITKVVDSCT